MTNLDHTERPGRRQTESTCWRRNWMRNLCSTHCLGWDPSLANHWVPSPVPCQTPLLGRQYPRHCCTSVTLHPQFHHLTWPFLGCQLRCHLSWWARMHCLAWPQDHLLRVWCCQELVIGRDFWDRVPVLTVQCRWDLQLSPQASHRP